MKFNNVTGTEDKFIIRLLNPGTEGRLESSQRKTHCKRKHKTKAVGGFWSEAMQVGDGGGGQVLQGARRKPAETPRTQHATPRETLLNAHAKQSPFQTHKSCSARYEA